MAGSSVAFERRSGRPSAPAWIRSILSGWLPRIEERIGTRLARAPSGRLEPALGEGQYGQVFALQGDPTRVFKITSDDTEGPLTAHIRTLQQQDQKIDGWNVIQVTTRIDLVFEFKPGKPFRVKGVPARVFGILREAVSCVDVSPEMAALLNRYTEGWEVNCSNFRQVDRVLGDLKTSSALHKLVSGEAGPDGVRLGRFLEWMGGENAPIMDVHESNVAYRMFDGPSGARVGQAVIYDFGVSKVCRPLLGYLEAMERR